MKKGDDCYGDSSKYWMLDILADVAAQEYGTMTSEEDNSKSSSNCYYDDWLLSRVSKPDFRPRDSNNWKLEILAEVATALLEYETTSKKTLVEENASLYRSVPRKKRSRRSHRSSSMAAQWIENKRSIACVDYKHEEERSLKKRKIVGRFEVGSSSMSMEERVLENRNRDPESPPSSCVTECSKKRPPINVSCKKLKIVRRLDVGSTQTTQPPPPEWLANVMREYNGHEPKLVIARGLFMSDLNKGLQRLQMPLNQLVNSEFLTEEEARIIHENYLKIRKTGLSAVLVDPLSKKYVVDFRKWNMNGNWNYVFATGWKAVLNANKFKVGDVYPVWSFRSGEGKLCFALVPKNSGHGGSTSGESGNGRSPPDNSGHGGSTSGESGNGCSPPGDS